eukprot:Skav230251  [mRNA]  locus=scaffold1520:68485:69030:+ [translate_table: standard]
MFSAVAEMVPPKKVVVAGGAFGQFLAEKRPELQAQCIGQPITAITELAAEKFKALSEDDKVFYQEKYAAATAKYDEDMKAFLDAGGEKKAIQRKGKKMDKEKKDHAQQGVLSGCFPGPFLAKNRDAFQKQCKSMPITATKLAAAKWKELSEIDGKIYEDEYQKKKKKPKPVRKPRSCTFHH